MASTRYKLQRYKFQKYQTGIVDIKLWKYANGGSEDFCQKRVEVIGGHCDGVDTYVYIKYLASDGKYKFIPFKHSIILQQMDSKKGDISSFIESASGLTSSEVPIGYSTYKKMQLSTPTTKAQYLTYVDVLSSPRVYLQKDTEELIDNNTNWIPVTVEGSNSFSVVKPKEMFTINITLPEYNNLSM